MCEKESDGARTLSLTHSLFDAGEVQKKDVRQGPLQRRPLVRESEFFIDNLLVRVHRCFWCTGLAPWEFEFPFPGSLISTFLVLVTLRIQGLLDIKDTHRRRVLR